MYFWTLSKFINYFGHCPNISVKSMKNTKKIIAERALELFNEKGIEYGGMRELAALLGMRVSNITYYFATKDDLVNELIVGLAALNNVTTQKYDTRSLLNFLETYQEIFKNQYAYRCLHLSFVHLFTHHKGMAEQYKQIEKKRKQRMANAFVSMMGNGYLKKSIDDDMIEKLTGHVSLLSRFWISESVISYYDKTTDEIMSHYLVLLSDIFQPYATARGRRDISEFITKLK